MRIHRVVCICSAVAAASMAPSAMADVGWGAGVTWTFGGPKPVSGPALGLKMFSTKKEEKAAASLGVDYSFADSNWRPNVGVAYLGKNNVYLGADVGYSFTQQGINFGGGFGYVDTEKKR